MKTNIKSVGCVHMHIPNKLTSKPGYHDLGCCGILKYRVPSCTLNPLIESTDLFKAILLYSGE